MMFQYGGSVLDMCVLAIVAKKDTYGYRLTQDVKKVLSISESTLYPVLRRLTKEHLLDTYDKPYDGRNRRYYSISPKGKEKLEFFRKEWKDYIDQINSIVGG